MEKAKQCFYSYVHWRFLSTFYQLAVKHNPTRLYLIKYKCSDLGFINPIIQIPDYFLLAFNCIIRVCTDFEVVVISWEIVQPIQNACLCLRWPLLNILIHIIVYGLSLDFFLLPFLSFLCQQALSICIFPLTSFYLYDLCSKINWQWNHTSNVPWKYAWHFLAANWALWTSS